MNSAAINKYAFEIQSGDLGYGKERILKGINIKVGHGELIGIVGRSGSGKSTLLKSLAGSSVQINGIVLVNGVDPRKSPHPVGLVPQIGDEILTSLSVEELITLGSSRIGLFTSKDERIKANNFMKMLGLIDKGHKRINELSGGQRQRVSIARALMGSTNLLLCDEPTSGADPVLAAEIIDLLGELASKGTTVLVATHDLAVVIPKVERVIGLGSGIVIYDGKINDFTDLIKSKVYGAELNSDKIR